MLPHVFIRSTAFCRNSLLYRAVPFIHFTLLLLSSKVCTIKLSHSRGSLQCSRTGIFYRYGKNFILTPSVTHASNARTVDGSSPPRPPFVCNRLPGVVPKTSTHNPAHSLPHQLRTRPHCGQELTLRRPCFIAVVRLRSQFSSPLTFCVLGVRTTAGKHLSSRSGRISRKQKICCGCD